MMRKSFILLVLCVCSLCNVLADDRSNEIILRMTRQLKSYGAYEVAFTAEAEGMGSSKGSYKVHGDKYRIKVDSQEQFSDGQFRYEINGYDNEISIDNVNLQSRNLLTNPSRAFDFGEDAFVGTHMGRQGVNDIIELVPKGALLDGVSSIVLYVDSQTGLPVELKYDFDGTPLDVKIDRITRLSDIDDSVFEFNRSDYSGYEIIDFR